MGFQRRFIKLDVFCGKMEEMDAQTVQFRRLEAEFLDRLVVLEADSRVIDHKEGEDSLAVAGCHPNAGAGSGAIP